MFRSVAFLLLAACATPPDADERFGATDDAARAQAEDLAYGALWAPDGAAARKGIDELRTLRVRFDSLSMAHTHVQQLVDGVPVWGGEAIVHLEADGAFAGVTDDLVAGVAVDTTPAYTREEALTLGVERHAGGWMDLSADPTADLWVLPQDDGARLAWRVTVPKVVGGADDRIDVLFLDAHDGELLWGYDNLQRATCSGETNAYGTVSVGCYSDGTRYYLEDTTDLVGTYSWGNTTTSLSDVTSTTTTFDSSAATKNAVEAHYVAQAVMDYYATAHGRNGIDGAGGPGSVSSHGNAFIASTTSYSTSYAGAAWDPTNRIVIYGDGDETSGTFTTLSIGGHEFTHGVIQYEANLTYSGEPGQVNESLADVFGSMIDRTTAGASAAVGDYCTFTQGGWGGTAFTCSRSSSDPASDGVSYDYYTSSVSTADVHYGAGIGNLAFYLLSEGGTHPRGRSTTVVTGIGADAAADIWYLALTSYMTSSTNWAGARTATLAAAAALYGSGSTQHTQVGNAWTAVGVAATPTCSTTTYTGSITRAGRSAYAPSSSGLSVTGTSQTVALSGPSSADFDLYLEKRSGKSWSVVGTAATVGTSTESIAYTGTSGTYRTRVTSRTGTGSYTVSWCR